jgi:hypothetical protein|tara:strand:+ start:215 stop:1051 length:837 start_codon:yes stop_codon:yes gene_type:complete
MANNPLTQYFRQPAIYVKLPSDGKYYHESALNMPENRELPVYPMTAIDEITYRTPDALFNGNAVTNVIKSCIPSIQDPWAIPAIDVDTILVAIRIASYGHTMEISTTCPHCQNEGDYGLDLRSVLERMKEPDYSAPIIDGDLTIFFKPMTYKDLNSNNQKQFEEQKMLQSLPGAEMADEQRMSALSAALMKITEITIHALSQSVAAVKTPDALVSEPEFIEDMLKNCDRRLFAKIRDQIISLKATSEIQPMTLKCSACEKEYQQAVTLDMTSFFEDAS